MMQMLRRNGHVQLRHYILGDLPENEQKTIELQLLADTQYFDELAIIEEELTDEYVAGQLNPRERALFEARFMYTAELRDSVRFAKALRRYTKEHDLTRDPSQRSSAHPVSTLVHRRIAALLASASVILIIALAVSVILLGRQASHLRDEYESLQREHAQSAGREAAMSKQLDEERAKAEEIRNQLQQERSERELLRQKLAAALADQPRSAVSIMASVTLLPGRSRTTEPAPAVRLSAATQELRLMLESGAGSYRGYVIEIQTAEGVPVWKQTVNTVRRGKDISTIDVTLPVPMLTMRDYLVLLAGVNADGASEHLATYNFTILRE